MIEKVIIHNYRLFKEFELDLSPDLNMLIGDNESGKSTLIEAISLALTGRVNGRSFRQELSPYFINMDASSEYLKAVQNNEKPSPPEIIIELYLKELEETLEFRGTNNLLSEDTYGLRMHAELADEYVAEYENYLDEPGQVLQVPTEYYTINWLDFSGNGVTKRRVPAISSIIDPTSIRLFTGVDYHLQEIVRNHLEPKERVELSRQYRNLKEEFSQKDSVQSINEKMTEESEGLTDKVLGLALDISHKYTWESSLIAHLDDIPFQFIGQGEKNKLKTLLALSQRASDAHVILIEEPEAHLSFSSLRMLIKRIEEQCEGKQLLIATHSNYVLNKLGLKNIILLDKRRATRISELPVDTINYFKKLPGYDTLRLVLSDGVFLVEGPSDELVIQRAYYDVHRNYPIEDGYDVISVGLSHKRFLDLAVKLERQTYVIRDNDGNEAEDVMKNFSDYEGHPFISIHIGEDPTLNTLEPQIVSVNKLSLLNEVLGTDYASEDEMLAYMTTNKTDTALKIFESDRTIEMPSYIKDAIAIE